MAISALIVAALGALFFGAFRVFERFDPEGGALLESTVIGLDKMASELQSSPVTAEIPLTGKKNEVLFPRLHVLGKAGELKEFKLGQVQSMSGAGFEFRKTRFIFDAARKGLMRKTGDAEAEMLIGHLKNAEFSYAVRDSGTGVWKWMSETPDDAAGAAVEAVLIRADFDKTAGTMIPGLSRTFLTARRHPREPE